MKPYTYLVGWSKHNLWYYGCQYNRNADPNQLWETYFTSSKNVSRLRTVFGEPDVVEVRKTFKTREACIHWEGTVLRRMDMKNKKDQWINRTYRETSGLVRYISVGFTEQHKQNMKASWTADRKKRFRENNVPHNKGVPMTDEARKHLSNVNTGKKRDPSWNKTGPKKGSVQSEEWKAKRLASQKETINMPEVKKKRSDAVKGRRFYTDGSKRYLLHPSDAKIQFNYLRVGF